MRYILWTPPDRSAPAPENALKTFFFGTVGMVVRAIVPQANPDYDHKIGTVNHWWLEVDDDGTPQREIGFDSNGKAIMAMPEGCNYGYITDSNVTFEDWDNDETVEASFEAQWLIALAKVES